MKTAFMGIGIYVLGFILVSLCSNLFNGGKVEYSYYSAIIFSILYLCSIMAVSASLILKELRKKSSN